MYFFLSTSDRKEEPTVALTDVPPWKLLDQILSELGAQRRRPAEDEADAAQVVLVWFFTRKQLDQYRGHEVELLEAEALDGAEQRGEFELGEDDDLITAVVAQQGAHREAVDVAKGEEAERDLGLDALLVASDTVEDA